MLSITKVFAIYLFLAAFGAPITVLLAVMGVISIYGTVLGLMSKPVKKEITLSSRWRPQFADAELPEPIFLRRK